MTKTQEANIFTGEGGINFLEAVVRGLFVNAEAIQTLFEITLATNRGEINWTRSVREENPRTIITWYVASWKETELELEEFFHGRGHRCRLRMDDSDGRRIIRDGLETNPLDALLVVVRESVKKAEAESKTREIVSKFLS